MDTALLAAVAAVAIIALALGALWWRARAAAGHAARRFDETRQAREREQRAADERIGALEAQCSELQERLLALQSRTWLADFPAEQVFALIARDEADLDGRRRAFGLVRDESGSLLPFLSERRMGHLEPGESFVAVRGQLVKLDPAELDAAAPAAAPASAPSRAVPPAGERAARHAPLRAPGRDPDATEPAAAEDPPAHDTDRTVLLSPTRDAQPADPDAGLPYLKVIAGPDEGTLFALPFTGATIGRDATNVVPLADGGASRVHCRIEYRRNVFVLSDNGSTNGTLCNDELVQERELAFGDVIQVADTRLCYSCEGHELRSADPARAVAAFQHCLTRQPDFVSALKALAFLLERDVARNKDAQPIWDRIARLERGR